MTYHVDGIRWGRTAARGVCCICMVWLLGCLLVSAVQMPSRPYFATRTRLGSAADARCLRCKGTRQTPDERTKNQPGGKLSPTKATWPHGTAKKVTSKGSLRKTFQVSKNPRAAVYRHLSMQRTVLCTLVLVPLRAGGWVWPPPA